MALAAYAEASLSRWQARNGHAEGHGVLTQLALIPVLRHRFDAGRSPWFVEGGIGATVTSSIYRSDNKRFSTAFNFGDHLGVGFSFGGHRQQELTLRAGGRRSCSPCEPLASSSFGSPYTVNARTSSTGDRRQMRFANDLRKERPGSR